MNITISVYGKNGSGKSVTAVNLACAFAKRGVETALVGANRYYGSIQHYLNMSIRPEKSLRALLSGGDGLSVKEFFTECPSVKNLYVASLADSDDCAGYRKYKPETAARFIGLVKNLYAAVLLDCDESTEDPLSMYGLTLSDKIVYVARPTLQHAIFAKAYGPIISGLQIDDKLAPVLINGAGNAAGDSGSGAFFPPGAAGKHTSLPYCKDIAGQDSGARPPALTHGVNKDTARYRKAVFSLADTLAPYGARARPPLPA